MEELDRRRGERELTGASANCRRCACARISRKCTSEYHARLGSIVILTDSHLWPEPVCRARKVDLQKADRNPHKGKPSGRSTELRQRLLNLRGAVIAKNAAATGTDEGLC
jgi:hypothetical protein